MTQALTAELILSRLAELTAVDDHSWQSGKFDYVAELGVSSADISELIRIARWWMEPWEEWPDEVRDSNAPLHASRTLGQLAAVEAIPVLLESMDSLEADGDEWYLEDFPVIFTLFGPACIEALSSYAAETTHNESCRSVVVEALCSIATDHPDSSSAVVQAFTRQLSLHEPGVYWLNAAVAGSLTKLKAVESAEVIERACAACVIDEGLYGGWEYFREQLGVEGLGLEQTGEPHNSIREFQRRYRQAEMQSQRVDARESLKKRKSLLKAKRKSQQKPPRRSRRAR